MNAFMKAAVKTTNTETIARLKKKIVDLELKLKKAYKEKNDLSHALNQKDADNDFLRRRIEILELNLQNVYKELEKYQNIPTKDDNEEEFIYQILTTAPIHTQVSHHHVPDHTNSVIDDLKQQFQFATISLWDQAKQKGEMPVTNIQDWILILWLNIHNTSYQGFTWKNRYNRDYTKYINNPSFGPSDWTFKLYHFINIENWEDKYVWDDLNDDKNGIFIAAKSLISTHQEISEKIVTASLWSLPKYPDTNVKSLLQKYLYLDDSMPHSAHVEIEKKSPPEKNISTVNTNEFIHFLQRYLLNSPTDKLVFESFKQINIEELKSIVKDMINQIKASIFDDTKIDYKFPFSEDELDFLTISQTIIVEKQDDKTIFAMDRIDNLLSLIVDPYQLLLCIDIFWYKIKYMFRIFSLNVYASKYLEMPNFANEKNTLVPTDIQNIINNKLQEQYGYSGLNIFENYTSQKRAGADYIDKGKEKKFWTKYLKQNLYRCTTKRLLAIDHDDVKERSPVVEFKLKGSFDDKTNQANKTSILLIDGMEYKRTLGPSPISPFEFNNWIKSTNNAANFDDFKKKLYDKWLKEKLSWINVQHVTRNVFYGNIWNKIENDLLKFIKIEMEEKDYLGEITWTTIAVYLKPLQYKGKSDILVLENFKEHFMYRIFDLIFDGLMMNHEEIKKINMDDLKKSFYELPYFKDNN